MEYLGSPTAFYDLSLADQVEAMGWWFARERREARRRGVKEGTGDPELDAFDRERGA